jgi:DNA polymerase elongation subunit (family B)
MAALDELIEGAQNGPRVLVLDIETSYHTVRTFKTRKAYISPDQIIEPSRVLCWAAMWIGSPKVRFVSEYHDSHEAVVREAHEVLSEADVVVGWNSANFDVKHLRREFILAGLPPPVPWRDVDLWRATSNRFRFASHKLDHVAQELGVGRKVKHTGFDLWVDCVDPDVDDDTRRKAWTLMKRYNIGDVKITAALFHKLRPWIPGFPHQGLYGGPRAGCPRCGSMQVEQEGYVRKRTGRYTLWRCLDCLGLHEGSHRVEAVHHTTV